MKIKKVGRYKNKNALDSTEQETTNMKVQCYEKLNDFVKENVKNPKMELLPYHMLGLDKYKALGLYDYIYKFEVPSKEKINDLEGVIENCGVGVVRYK